MSIQLIISGDTYYLLCEQGRGWIKLAALAGGGGMLISPLSAINELSLERAIEVAEDWLMPHSAHVRGQLVEVVDTTGRLEEGLQEVLSVASGTWSIDHLEGFFLRLVDLTTGRWPSRTASNRPLFIADMVLLRELAHHGQPKGIKIKT